MLTAKTVKSLVLLQPNVIYNKMTLIFFYKLRVIGSL